MLNFARRNFSTCTQVVKETVYKTLVRPHLEYSQCVWDPYTKHQIDQLEGVQRRAVRFVSGRYDRDVSMTLLRQQLGWHTLQERRLSARIGMMGKIKNDEIAIPLPSYVREGNQRGLRNQTPYAPIHSNRDQFKFSYFPRTIHTWNVLPPNIGDLPSGKLVKGAMSELITQGAARVIYQKECTQYLGHKHPLKHIY